MGNRMQLDVSGINELMKRIEKLGGQSKAIADEALKETHKIVTELAADAVQKQNLPAKGKYSTGDTAKSLYKDAAVKWTGDIGAIDVGFSIRKGGLASIFLIYGTPRMKKSQKMYNAFYGKQTLKKVHDAQEKVLYDEIRRIEK